MLEKNKYEVAIETLVKECGFSKSAEEYEICCNKAESDCTTESNPFRPKEPEVAELVILMALLLCVVVSTYFFFKKGTYKKILPPYSQETKAIFSGWVIWCFGVASYAFLFDEEINYWAWLTLPVIFATTIYFWVKNFVLKKP